MVNASAIVRKHDAGKEQGLCGQERGQHIFNLFADPLTMTGTIVLSQRWSVGGPSDVTEC